MEKVSYLYHRFYMDEEALLDEELLSGLER